MGILWYAGRRNTDRLLYGWGMQLPTDAVVFRPAEKVTHTGSVYDERTHLDS